MPAWAITRFVTFNLVILIVGVIFAVRLYRNRTTKTAIGGMFFALIASGFLVFLTHQYKFFLVALACSVLFLHLPLWLTVSAVLLWRRARWFSIMVILLAILFAGVAYDAFLYEPTALEVTRYEITDPRIEQPMRIVVIADFQTDQIGEHERNTLETALEQKPDLILFAGDYFAVNDRQDWYKLLNQFWDLTKELDFDAPLGVYAVQGNVDYWTPWPLMFQHMKGERMNRTRSFDINGIRLTCLSEPDSFNGRLRLNGPEEDRFHIVMGHSPDYALGQVDADLLLAGHTHGGQICFPLIGPLSTGCSVPRDWVSGMKELPGLGIDPSLRRLIVSRGTGMERNLAPRIRFLCRPELVVIDLKPEKPSEDIQNAE
ncbi:MAG: metallophosphoesterase [Planctomycetia bacterium]|jgi:predicted MPP superfamily phosphohydrolase